MAISEYKYKGYHIYKNVVMNVFPTKWQFKVVSYAGEFEPIFFPTLVAAKKFIEKHLINFIL